MCSLRMILAMTSISSILLQTFETFDMRPNGQCEIWLWKADPHCSLPAFVIYLSHVSYLCSCRMYSLRMIVAMTSVLLQKFEIFDMRPKRPCNFWL